MNRMISTIGKWEIKLYNEYIRESNGKLSFYDNSKYRLYWYEYSIIKDSKTGKVSDILIYNSNMINISIPKTALIKAKSMIKSIYREIEDE